MLLLRYVAFKGMNKFINRSLLPIPHKYIDNSLSKLNSHSFLLLLLLLHTKDPSKNIVYASNKYDEDVFVQARSEFHVESLHWISGKEPTHLLDTNGSYRFILKIRHGPRLAAGTLEMQIDEEEDDAETEIETTNKRNGGIIKLDEKDGGLAPGQYVVFYTNDAECLGSGIISERHWAKFLMDTQSRVTIAHS